MSDMKPEIVDDAEQAMRRRGLKEPFNSISHMVGGGLSVIGTLLMFWLADAPAEYASVAAYGTGLVTLYALSSVYHGVRGEQGADSWLERLDHVAIYLLIFGTYTPICLLVLPPVWGWSMLAAVGAVSIVGIVLALTVPLGPAWLHPVGYIALGWAAVVAAPVLFTALPAPAVAWLIIGGVVYTGGSVFYAMDLRAGIVHSHHVWHVAVIAGSLAHYIMVAVHVL